VNRERDRETEFEEILGFHLEQAFRYRAELGPLDEAGRALGTRAGAKLGAAGRRAFARGDMPAAGRLIGRAVQLLPEEDPKRLELVAELGEALMEQGRFDDAIVALDEGLATAARVGDPRLEARIELIRRAVDLFASEEASATALVVRRTEAAIEVFERVGDEAGLARAWRILMVVHGTAGRYDVAADAADRTVDHAVAAGDARLAARGAGGYASVALRGPLPVSTVLTRCDELLERVRGDRKAEAVICGVMAQLHAMQGRFDTARELYRRGATMLADLGPSVTASSWSIESSEVEMHAGEPAAAVRDLRRDYDALEALGERYFRSTIAALLARALVELGEDAEANVVAGIAAELADEDDAQAQVLWRRARALVQARAGEPIDAAALALEAVDLARQTVDIDLLADAIVDLADVVPPGETGRRGELLREALALYEQKEDTVAAARIRVRIGEVGVA
jgi:tetratricopeptide (TPR) repeat protein